MYAMDSPSPSWGVKLNLDPLPSGFAPSGKIRQSEPHAAFDPNFKIDVRYFELTASFEVALSVGKEALVGEVSVSGVLAFQICNDKLRVCLPPTEVPFAMNVVVENG